MSPVGVHNSTLQLFTVHAQKGQYTVHVTNFVIIVYTHIADFVYTQVTHVNKIFLQQLVYLQSDGCPDALIQNVINEKQLKPN